MRKSAGYLGKALLIEIRPLPMAMAILASFFGAVIGFQVIGVKYPLLLIHVVNVVVILYSSHLVDTYRDLRKGEYQLGYKPRFLLDAHDPERVITLNPRHYLYAMLVTYPVALILSGILIVETGLIYLILAACGLLLSVGYSSGLDRVFILGDLAWDMGVVLSFAGGFYVTTQTITPEIVVMSLILLPILCGVKIIDAEPDVAVDSRSQPRKTTIPVKLGLKWSHRLAYLLMIPPVLLLMLLTPALHPTLIYPLLIALVLILFSYRYPAEKGIYFIACGIILFLTWAILVLI